MSKKKFKDRKIGQFLTEPIVSSVIELIPFGIGSFAGSILKDVKASEPGSLDKDTLQMKIAKMVIYAAIIMYLIHSGNLTEENSEAVKVIISG